MARLNIYELSKLSSKCSIVPIIFALMLTLSFSANATEKKIDQLVVAPCVYQLRDDDGRCPIRMYKIDKNSDELICNTVLSALNNAPAGAGMIYSDPIFVKWNKGYFRFSSQSYVSTLNGVRSHAGGWVEWFYGDVLNNNHYYVVAKYQYSSRWEFELFDDSVENYVKFLQSDSPELHPVGNTGGLLNFLYNSNYKTKKNLKQETDSEALITFPYNDVNERTLSLINGKYYEVSRKYPYKKTESDYIRVDIIENGIFKNVCLIESE